jgi:hypothetical protein
MVAVQLISLWLADPGISTAIALVLMAAGVGYAIYAYAFYGKYLGEVGR